MNVRPEVFNYGGGSIKTLKYYGDKRKTLNTIKELNEEEYILGKKINNPIFEIIKNYKIADEVIKIKFSGSQHRIIINLVWFQELSEEFIINEILNKKHNYTILEDLEVFQELSENIKKINGGE